MGRGEQLVKTPLGAGSFFGRGPRTISANNSISPPLPHADKPSSEDVNYVFDMAGYLWGSWSLEHRSDNYSPAALSSLKRILARLESKLLAAGADINRTYQFVSAMTLAYQGKVGDEIDEFADEHHQRLASLYRSYRQGGGAIGETMNKPESLLILERIDHLGVEQLAQMCGYLPDYVKNAFNLYVEQLSDIWPPSNT